MAGITFLADNTVQIMLSLAIERKIIKGRYTDLVWYIENIIYRLLDIGVNITSYELQEYED